MLSMTKKTGYGLIALRHLALLAKGELASARGISEEYGIPTALLMNVLKELASAEYVESVRGARGGYRLLKAPGEINFIGLMDVLEGPMKLAECITGDLDAGVPTCKIMGRCPIADPVHRIHRKIHDYLKTVTLEEVLYEADNSCQPADDSPETNKP